MAHAMFPRGVVMRKRFGESPQASAANRHIAEHGRQITRLTQAAQWFPGGLIKLQSFRMPVLAEKDVAHVARQPRQAQLIAVTLENDARPFGPLQGAVVLPHVDKGLQAAVERTADVQVFGAGLQPLDGRLVTFDRRRVLASSKVDVPAAPQAESAGALPGQRVGQPLGSLRQPRRSFEINVSELEHLGVQPLRQVWIVRARRGEEKLAARLLVL